MNGILVVDKPQDFTSFDVVAKLRGICKTKKIGHGGTLDPMATGVLPVFIGPAVKAVDLQLRQDKAYEAVFLFGIATDTGDITGEVLRREEAKVQLEDFEKIIQNFVGERSQLPPMYSAVKINGKALYRYAREGKTVERKPRNITIHSMESLGQVGENQFSVRVHCSKGTYIRVLAEEVGEAMGLPATLAALRRVGAGVFDIEQAHTFAEIQAAKDTGRLEELLCPLEEVFRSLPDVEVSEDGLKRLLNGAPVYGVRLASGRYRLVNEGRFIGLGNLDTDGTLQGEKLFCDRG